MNTLTRFLTFLRGLPHQEAEHCPGDYIAPARDRYLAQQPLAARQPACPLCNGRLLRIANDPANLWQCETEGCFFRQTPVPQKVAIGLQERKG